MLQFANSATNTKVFMKVFEDAKRSKQIDNNLFQFFFFFVVDISIHNLFYLVIMCLYYTNEFCSLSRWDFP